MYNILTTAVYELQERMVIINRAPADDPFAHAQSSCACADRQLLLSSGPDLAAQLKLGLTIGVILGGHGGTHTPTFWSEAPYAPLFTSCHRG